MTNLEKIEFLTKETDCLRKELLEQKKKNEELCRQLEGANEKCKREEENAYKANRYKIAFEFACDHIAEREDFCPEGKGPCELKDYDYKNMAGWEEDMICGRCWQRQFLKAAKESYTEAE